VTEVIDGLPYNTAGYQMINSAQAAKIFGVPPLAVTRWARGGSIPFTRLPNGHLRFSREWCEAYMQNQGRVSSENGGKAQD
jgi:predicted site-specific integrase-resolvase